MGNKHRTRVSKRKHLNRLKRQAKMMVEKKMEMTKSHGPKSLAALCRQVVRKFKLIASPAPEPKRFTPPETFTVVGGKPLRKRSGRPNKEEVQKKSKRSSPKSLAVLCQLVIEEYRLLPQTEESSLATSNRLLIPSDTPRRKWSGSQHDETEKRRRGRSRKSIQNLKNQQQKIKDPRGRPRKDSNSGKIEQPPETEEEPISYTYVRIKEETDSLPDVDPLQGAEDEEDYTIEIKLDACDDDDKITHKYPVVPSSQTSQAPRSHVLPGSSKTDVMQTPHFVTVVMDEYQRFANRIAEQLREFPPETALLLQSGIQAMIDNERQLMDED